MKRVFLLSIAALLTLSLAAVGSQYTPDLPFQEVESAVNARPADFIYIGRNRVHVQSSGDIYNPPLILLHGMGASLYAWDKVAPELRKHFYVISIDLPFHGLTGPAAIGNCQPSQVAQFVFAVMDKLDITKADVAGNSWGGQIALEMARSNSDRVNRVVLIDAAGLDAPPSQAAKMAENPIGRLILTHFTSPFMVRRTLKQTMADPKLVTNDLVAQFVVLNRREGNRAGALNCRRASRLALQNSTNSYASVKQPTLILWGKQDQLIPVANAMRFSRQIPNSSLQIYENAGHLPMQEVASEVAGDMELFLIR